MQPRDQRRGAGSNAAGQQHVAVQQLAVAGAVADRVHRRARSRHALRGVIGREERLQPVLLRPVEVVAIQREVPPLRMHQPQTTIRRGREPQIGLR